MLFLHNLLRRITLLNTRYIPVFILIAFIAMMFSPAGVYAQELTIDVHARIEPVYSFSAPLDVKLTYPETGIALGDFTIGELMIASGETLSVVLTPGELASEKGDVLPYTVSFSPPESFDHTGSGGTYPVAVQLNEKDFAAAVNGTYKAYLLFEVISHPEGRAVWQGTTVLTVVKKPGLHMFVNGLLEDKLYLWCLAAGTAVTCTALILFLVKRAKTRKKNIQKEIEAP
jgi:hypothetical protein